MKRPLDSYDSDEMFANFRSVEVGNIAPNRLYRSASPCDNQHNRAVYVNNLIEAAGLTAMIDQEGPYLIHCTEGKDRTGFMCMLLEALCAADYYEIVDDYMITYWNYYKFTKVSDPDRYNTLVENLLDPMIQVLFEEPDVDVTTADLTEGAENYLKSIGMTSAEIDKLKARLTDRKTGGE